MYSKKDRIMVFTIYKNLPRIPNGEEFKVWKQFVVSFLASIPFLTYGVETTALSTSAHAGHFDTSPGDVPWNTTATVLAAALSAPMFSILVDRYGRKSGIYVINLMQGASCIPLFLPASFTSQITLHVMAGIASGGLFTVIPTYIREINNSHRAVFLSLMVVMANAGYMMELIIDLEAMMFVMVGLVAAQFLSLLIMMETPSYLVKVGKTDIAKKNLAELYCLQIDDAAVSKELQTLKDEIDRVFVTKFHCFGILKNPIYRDATKIGVVLYISLVLCGSIAFLDHDKVLAQLKMTFGLEKTLLLSSMFAGSVFCLCIVHFVERKYILTSGFVIMALSTGVLAVYTQADLTVDSLQWVAVASLGVLVFGFGMSWGLPVVIMCEIYNLKIRPTMLGFLYTLSQLLKLIHVTTYQYIEDYMGLYIVMYIFAGVNIYAGVYSMFKIPDLKGKTVRQIERQLKRVPLLHFNVIKA